MKSIAAHDPINHASIDGASHPASSPATAETGSVALVYSALAAMVVAILLLLKAPSVLQDPDNWWHIRVGLDMMSSLTFPTVDTYSHTFTGEPWIAKEWLGQVLLALAYTAAGWNGVALLTITMSAFAVFLLARYLSDDLKPITAMAMVLGVALLNTPLYNARPFIFTFAIIVVWTAELYRAARNDRAPSLWLLPLLCLWANLHGTFTFGFIIAFFAGLHVLERRRLSDPVLLAKWIGFGLLCPVATLLNPYGYKAILATFTVSHGNEAVSVIDEWAPFDPSTQYLQEWTLLLMVFGLLVSRLRIGWAKAAFLIFTLHLFLLYTRFAYLLLLLGPLVLAKDIAEQYPRFSTREWAEEKRDGLEQFLAMRSRQILAVMACVLVVVVAVFITGPRISPSQQTSAEGALSFVKENGVAGNVLNSYNFGGTLIFHGIKTYIDGRTDQLFLGGFMTVDRKSTKTSGKPILNELLQKYRIDWALLTADDGRIPFFDEMPGWSRAYGDDNAVVYLRD